MDARKQKKWAWIGAAIVVLVLIGVAFGAMWRPGQSGSPTAPTYGPTGGLVSGFSQNLVLDQSPSITNSYSIPQSGTSTQYTANWNSSSSMSSLYAAYQSYFKQNNWTFLGQDASHASYRNIEATNGTQYVNVTILAQGKGSQVMVSYLEK